MGDNGGMPVFSPLLALPGAVAGDGIDAQVAAHYGSFNGEQRTLSSGDGFVDLSHRDVVRVSGLDRLTWLHSLTTQDLVSLTPGVPTTALVLSPQGHVEHAFHAVDDGEAFTAHLEPGTAAPLVAFLEGMRFMMRVEIADLTDELAVAWRPSGKYDVFPRRAGGIRSGRGTCVRNVGLRGAAHRPRGAAVRTRHRPPDDPRRGWLDSVRRSPRQRLLPRPGDRGAGAQPRPAPRRLTMLHLDGSENRLPTHGSAVTLGGRQVGTVGSSARHFEAGPIALALLKRSVPMDAQLEVDSLVAAQEVVVDPEVGLHVRPLR